LKETFEAMGFSKPAAQSYARIVAGEAQYVVSMARVRQVR
jgi:hypothetical protein